MSDYKVLVPLDGSRLAEHALAFLPALGHFGKLDVTLVTAVDFSDALLKLVPAEDQERESNLLHTYLREIVDDLQKHLGAAARYEISKGEASATILEYARRINPDMLVISTHGRSGIARWRRGAIADKVIRSAACPVLAVGPKAMEKGQWLEAEAIPPFKDVLVPLDGSERAEQALPAAEKFAEQYGSSLHLLQVMPYVPLASGFVEPPARLHDSVLAAGRSYLEGVKTRVAGSPRTVTSVLIGAPAAEIERYVKDRGIDLIVMTSQGRSGLARATLGSVTDRVIGAGPPVLVVRTQG